MKKNSIVYEIFIAVLNPRQADGLKSEDNDREESSIHRHPIESTFFDQAQKCIYNLMTTGNTLMARLVSR